MRANNLVHCDLMVVLVCLHFTLPHYHHYADVSEGIEFLKCSSDTFWLNQFSQSSFMQYSYMGLCVFSLPIFLWWLWGYAHFILLPSSNRKYDIFAMRIHILVRWYIYIKTSPRFCIRGPNFAIIVAADVLVPINASPSTGIVLSTNSGMFFIQISPDDMMLILFKYHDVIQNGRRDPAQPFGISSVNIIKSYLLL